MKRCTISISLFLIAMLLQSASAQTTKPSILNDVGIDQKLNSQVPADLQFRDEAGTSVRLGDYFGKRPMILVLVYFKCPMLCTMVLNDLNKVLGVMNMNVGEQFDILTVSFDPTETPDLAAKKKKAYVFTYARPHAAEGWHFLTGNQDSIKALTDSVGFRYAWDPKFQQFAHASGIMILTPDGKVSRYFYGVEYSATDLQNALTDAAGGKISTPAPQVLLYCFRYDPSTGHYSLIVTRAMQVGALMTMGSIGAFWMLMYRRGKH
jgi:protein SCO1/2